MPMKASRPQTGKPPLGSVAPRSRRMTSRARPPSAIRPAATQSGGRSPTAILISGKEPPQIAESSSNSAKSGPLAASGVRCAVMGIDLVGTRRRFGRGERGPQRTGQILALVGRQKSADGKATTMRGELELTLMRGWILHLHPQPIGLKAPGLDAAAGILV